MIRTTFLLLAIVLAVAIFAPQLGILLLIAVFLLSVAGLAWSYFSPFNRHGRGGRR
ncbi:hypothetical protein LTV02_18000 [Nocardia yamanashiensis]|uniref:hypothetical protein n=1 Tax=Nocardia yamanashiensis TaxID=209247 RepID=UPI001E32AA80|nr:hypothetical protein [Nocardia yamanashiensis]UGT45165.1 hypothetical protein LTV02_18000 [Nocardia yamanashiensis]